MTTQEYEEIRNEFNKKYDSYIYDCKYIKFVNGGLPCSVSFIYRRTDYSKTKYVLLMANGFKTSPNLVHMEYDCDDFGIADEYNWEDIQWQRKAFFDYLFNFIYDGRKVFSSSSFNGKS